jgi:hypothetical protein
MRKPKMGDLFNRAAVLQMGTLRVTNLRISFTITKSAQPEPNDGEINVWNLSETSRALLKEQIPLYLKLEAGYGNDIEQIFEGDIRPSGVYSAKSGQDWVTTFKAADGLNAYRSARIQHSFAQGTKFTDVIKKAVKSMGVNATEALAKVRQGDFSGAANDFFGGTVLSGPVPKELERLLAASGHDYFIENGQLKIQAKGAAIVEEAVSLTPNTGLIGSPEPGADGFTKFRSLLQPKLSPRRKAKLKTESYDGFYIVNRVTHNGDTRGANWYSDCEAKAI